MVVSLTLFHFLAGRWRQNKREGRARVPYRLRTDGELKHAQSPRQLSCLTKNFSPRYTRSFCFSSVHVCLRVYRQGHCVFILRYIFLYLYYPISGSCVLMCVTSARGIPIGSLLAINNVGPDSYCSTIRLIMHIFCDRARKTLYFAICCYLRINVCKKYSPFWVRGPLAKVTYLALPIVDSGRFLDID